MVIGLAGQATASAKYQWELVTDSPAFHWRDGAGALVYDEKMWLLGGWSPSVGNYWPHQTGNDVWSSTNGADWSLVKPNTYVPSVPGTYDPDTDWEGRHTAGYVVYANNMWIVGGDGLQGHYQPDVWNSTDGVNWTQVNKDNPAPWGQRMVHHTLVHDGKIWVMGGQTSPRFVDGEQVYYNDVWNSTDGVNWTQVQTQGPMWSARGMIGGSIVKDGRMWVVGGGTFAPPEPGFPNGNPDAWTFHNDVWSSADGIHWTQHLDDGEAPWRGRLYHDVAVYDDNMWVLEGVSGGGNTNGVWYSPDGVSWTEILNTPWDERHAASVYVYDDALWMVAGNNIVPPDVWKLTVVPEPTSAVLIGICFATGVAGRRVRRRA